MALQKDVISARTGQTLGYHEVLTVSFNGSKMGVVVASYVNKAAKDAGKNFADAMPQSFDYDGSVIEKSIIGYAQDQLLTLPEFAKASVVD